MDHPMITRIERTGNPNPVRNPNRPELWGLEPKKKELSIAEFHNLRFGKKVR